MSFEESEQQLDGQDGLQQPKSVVWVLGKLKGTNPCITTASTRGEAGNAALPSEPITIVADRLLQSVVTFLWGACTAMA